VSWRAVFFVNIPFCLAAAALMLRYVREGRDEGADRRIDFLGMAVLTAALVAIAYGFDKGEAWGWGSAQTLATILGGVALLGLSVLVERRAPAPLVDLSLFRNRPFVAVVAAGSLSNVVYCFVAVFSALYLQQARGLSPLDAGLVFLALSGGAGAAAYFSGRLAERFPADRLMAAGLLTSAAFITLLTFTDSLWAYTPVFFVCGIGVGLGWALTNVATQGVVRPEDAGVASGVALTSLVLLAAVGVAIGTTALDLLAGSPESAGQDTDALDALLRVGAGLAFAGAVVILAFVRQRVRPDELRAGAIA
jgi:predicted MFS family arabinose efflux permease